ncbi:uncharacterized protein [Onthophagus taurus]|uniref:uncharacterized protein n=1 Tax=Onthophagus taurus TaxID=166361 RepID=UPI0039BE6E16
MNEDLFSVAHLNVRSLLPKTGDVAELLQSENFDILCVSETWLSPSIDDALVSIDGYCLYRRDRVGRGGGVAIYARNVFASKSIAFEMRDSCEQVWIDVRIGSVKCVVGCIYRPPTTNNTTFMDDLEFQLAELRLRYSMIFCLGDFNINLLIPDHRDTVNLLSVIQGMNMLQIINEPTRVSKTASSKFVGCGCCIR